ncbi:MAG: long-chain fatty acid--CoA ligase [Gammaproteobacteria bacterium]|nr:MAG: long-chain fatty acid--CoA ligase [Gammaproteobacteria bacterium]
MPGSFETWSEDVITAEDAGTLHGLFRERVRRSPQREAYRYWDRRAEAWRSLTWAETEARVRRWRRALAAEGLRPGDRVAIQLRNGPAWVYFDQAALSLGLVVVPLYVEDRPDNAAWILQDAAARLLLVQSDKHWKRLAPAVEEVDSLQRVVVLEGEPEAPGGRAVAAEAWLAAADADSDPEPVAVAPDDLATLVYTSGTTGRPKGVMLSHRNILFDAHAAIATIDVYQQDRFLSFLPLSHMLERTGGYYLPMMAGASVAYARSVSQLAADLRLLRPTVLIAVPRIFERFHARLEAQLAQASALRRLLFRQAVAVGWRRFEYRQGRACWHPALLLWPLFARTVARRVHAVLGGRLRAAVSGGAALPLPVARTFLGLGLPLLQGYGLTECSPVISVNLFENNDPSSVGVPLRGLEVRIDERREVLVRGPAVMLGYWNNHAATREVIDAAGWLHTGDQGRLQDGRLYLTGRIKDILVLSNGEKVPPGDMEAAIALDPLVDQVVIVGEGRPWLAAVVALDGEHWFGLARELGLDPYDRDSLGDARLQRRLLERIQERLHDFPGYARIRRVLPVLDPWTVENGLLTPTLKVRRARVLDRYAEAIEALYAGG